MPGAQAMIVLPKCDIKYPVAFILNAPMTANCFQKFRRTRLATTDIISNFFTDFPVHLANARHRDQRLRLGATDAGAVTHLDFVWLVADTLNAFMAFPNLVSLVLLSVVAKVTQDHFSRELPRRGVAVAAAGQAR